MKFLKAVQNCDVAGPLRRTFTEKKWAAAHTQMCEDEADNSLYEAGLLINKKMGAIRANLPLTTATDINPVTKIRAILGLANQNAYVLKKRLDAPLEVGRKSDKPVVAINGLNTKLQVISGVEYGPDELLDAAVSAVEMSAGGIVTGAPSLSGNTKYLKVKWDDAQLEFHCGVHYIQIEEIWDECLWNDLRIVPNGSGFRLAEKDEDWLIRYRVSLRRMDNLLMQFHAQSMSHLYRMPAQHIFGSVPRRVSNVSKRNGRCHVAVDDYREADFNDAASWFVASTYAQEPYYGDLLQSPMARLGGASVKQLMDGWYVVQSITRKLFDFHIDDDDASPPHVWIEQFVPLIPVDDLTRGVAEAARINHPHAKRIVEFLTYGKAPSQELYSQPLIPVGTNTVSPCLAAIQAPNLRRLVDVWLRQLDVSLDVRGPAFEGYMRSRLREMAEDSPLLSTANVLPNAMRFAEPDERTEEIDVVIVLGKLVLLGEAKCILQPTEAKEIALHRNRVIDAAAQINRKAEAVRRNPVAFQTQLAALGIECPADFKVLPLVILNNPIHVGFAVDGVPVADEFVFEVFFSGVFKAVSRQTASGTFETLDGRQLYTDLEHAATIAESYFAAPPQMEVFRESIRHRSFPVPPVTVDDWWGEQVTVECSVNVNSDKFLP